MNLFRRDGILPLALPLPLNIIRNAPVLNSVGPMGEDVKNPKRPMSEPRAPNVKNPKRKGGSLVAPSTQRARTSRDTDDPPEDAPPNPYGVPAWKEETLVLDVTQDGPAQAVRYPLLGWPDFAQFFLDSRRVPSPHSIFDAAPYCEMPVD